ncbi:AfsR/SARP family transcriptional regulator [Glycomyces xiaoerkulensis]|uniref:AfsR/SARP family transcriptional regulator n=1 Tax=Glycomyces xiaoerkulensis TaxID=2038139 RepID=UPI0018E4BF5E|nr:BTAD domain-containing putative transcriptional regulator [Glycomyces xiaoerkulensis]
MRASPTAVRLLGPIGAARDGREIHLGPSRERECFAALVLRCGAPVLVEQLIDDLWDAEPPASAVNVVHTYVSRLRGRLVAPESRDHALVRSLHPGYSIAPDAVELDVHEFESERRSGMALLWAGHLDQAHEALRRAIDHWSGTIALHGAVGPLACRERQRLTEHYLDAVEHCLALQMKEGRGLDTIAELTALVGKHPFRERLWMLFMLALAVADRRGEALIAYHDLRRRLNEDLGINPSQRVQRLFGDLVSEKPPGEVWDDHFRLTTQNR